MSIASLEAELARINAQRDALRDQAADLVRQLDALRAEAAVDELVRDLTPEQQAALIKALGNA